MILAHQIQEKVESEGFKTLRSFINHKINNNQKFKKLYKFVRNYFKKNQQAHDILFKNLAGPKTNQRTIEEIEGLLRIELSDASEENLMILAHQIQKKVESEGFKTLRSFMEHKINDNQKFKRLYNNLRRYHFKKDTEAHDILFKNQRGKAYFRNSEKLPTNKRISSYLETDNDPTTKKVFSQDSPTSNVKAFERPVGRNIQLCTDNENPSRFFGEMLVHKFSSPKGSNQHSMNFFTSGENMQTRAGTESPSYFFGKTPVDNALYFHQYSMNPLGDFFNLYSTNTGVNVQTFAYPRSPFGDTSVYKHPRDSVFSNQQSMNPFGFFNSHKNTGENVQPCAESPSRFFGETPPGHNEF